MGRNILVVEDDKNISDLIYMYLVMRALTSASPETEARRWRNFGKRSRT